MKQDHIFIISASSNLDSMGFNAFFSGIVGWVRLKMARMPSQKNTTNASTDDKAFH